MEITSIVIVTGQGPDLLILKTNLPDGCWPYKDKALVKLEVAAGNGKEYAEKHFPTIECKVISH